MLASLFHQLCPQWVYIIYWVIYQETRDTKYWLIWLFLPSNRIHATLSAWHLTSFLIEGVNITSMEKRSIYVIPHIKAAEDDIAFKLAILKKSLHLNDNTGLCSIIQSSKLVLGSLLAKNNFFVQFWTTNFASSRMANRGSGLPAEWPFRSQNAIEASDSPLPGGLWVKRLITHALCSLAYSDIVWCKLFLIFTMKCLYWVFFCLQNTI